MIMVAGHSQLQASWHHGRKPVALEQDCMSSLTKPSLGTTSPLLRRTTAPPAWRSTAIYLPTTIKPPAHLVKKKHFAPGSVDFQVSVRLTRSMMQMGEAEP
ncbi:unnamed protein product, partial [Discosporangium mesarthrocarpum]